ncbi:T-complex protein 1 subunit alpha-like isoform X2 [Actinidia eriantha]|uniref:T-complex protein 1 subunit alpha-like isoform X2 n=1 Tax=Actinidia eriantha TaxID=165200 RepID=UPI002587A154|nr:T-complex protein 1 subunit alpha-like isoform X2 [Actinidia eriantha]
MAIEALTPDIMGERQSGWDVRTRNVVACQAIANIVKSSVGPVGLDKMLVDDIGDATVSNDGATILKMLDFEHPAAKVLIELAELQDREVGDGTTSAVIIAADLLKVEMLGKDSLVNCAKTSMSSKLIAQTVIFSQLFATHGINILKAHGKSAKDSYLLNGYALNTGHAAQGMPPRVAPARIACLGFNLQRTKMQLGIQVLVTDLRELEKICQRFQRLLIWKERKHLIHHSWDMQMK